jgi:hypothetical protein
MTLSRRQFCGALGAGLAVASYGVSTTLHLALTVTSHVAYGEAFVTYLRTNVTTLVWLGELSTVGFWRLVIHSW